jgi:NAD(P)-dependent dehydrogenase (short-subunit alcohol dehydrogenase family)
VGEASTAKNVAAAAIEQFGGIDTLVNNAGIFFTKPFTDYTTEDVRKLISTNLYGFVYLSQLAIKHTLSPMGSIADTQEIVDAVVFLAEAPHITGEVLHVDGGAHLGKW